MKFIFQSTLATAVGLGMVLASGVAEAANCTIENWSSATGLTDDNAGTQGINNRRYAGPCGLRVPVSATPRYLQHNTPRPETVFNVRFYFFLNDVTNDVTIFKALASNNDPVITATYDQSASAVNVDIANSSATQTLIAGGVNAAGWNSLEIQWKADAAEEVKVILANSVETDEVIGSAVDTSGLAIDRAQLGVLGVTVGATGSIDFDDYDSRRDTVPGRLCRGLTVDESVRSSLSLADVAEIFNEVASFGTSRANGQPDFDGNGLVTLADVSAVFSRVANFASSCADNR